MHSYLQKFILNKSRNAMVVTAMFIGGSAAMAAQDRQQQNQMGGQQASPQGQQLGDEHRGQAQHDRQKQAEVVTVEFQPGQHNLSESDRQKLRDKLSQYARVDAQQRQPGAAPGALPGTGAGPADRQGVTGQPGTAAQPGATDQRDGVATGPGARGQREGDTGIMGQQDEARGIDEIRIVAWSDQEFNPDENLADQHRDLARQRAESIENFINDELNVDASVSTFNMAESAGLLARTFNTEEDELKSIFARRGTPQAQEDVDNPELMKIRDEGGPSKAVVLITKDKDRGDNGGGILNR